MAKKQTETKDVIIVSSETIPGYEILEYKGLVWASTVRSKFILSELVAVIRAILGGEVKEYWQLVNEGRNVIMKRLNKNANDMEANGVIAVRLATSQIIPGTIEILAYGTAVRIKKK